jgi:lysophospholipase L1-like esterase
MKREQAGALAVFVAAGAVGAIGVYLAWGLIGSTLHPAAPQVSDAKRTTVAAPAPRDDVKVVGLAPGGEVTPAPKPVVTPEARPGTKVEPGPDLGKGEDASPDAPIEIEVADPKVFSVGGGATGVVKRGLSILQIGDSHTSADFLSGELRRRLQARYGRGGTGYMTAGHPHIGVRSSTMKITASSGWTYKSLQKPDAQVGAFWLSGYNAIATAANETMSFAYDEPRLFDMIEIEAVGQPGGGAIDIKLDGGVATHFDLSAQRIEPVVIRLLPTRGPTEKVREVSVTTTAAGTVTLASVSIYNNRAGVTYNSVGYVGAQAGLVAKMSDTLFADDLRRINPQIVVLAFGTNEASNEHLDPAQYAKTYEKVVRKIKTSLPNAAIVVVSPPDFNEVPAGCPKEKVAEATCRRSSPDAVASSASGTPALASAPESKGECVWRTPARLAQIRDVQREIARRNGLTYWNWATIMPSECGAHQWFTASPPLMSRDHVHFTAEGYKRSAAELLNTLIPMIEKVRVGANAVSNN